MVDDPYTFGQIAAANALSDVYAMGASPTVAMNLLCYPTCLDQDAVQAILAGGYDKVKEAGAIIAGGHTIQDPEPKYGLCVSGFIHPKKILLNSGAKDGDCIILTKPLGMGILSTAAKADLLTDEEFAPAVRSMATLNRKTGEIIASYLPNACTDITGFGLLGHAFEMADGSKMTMRIFSKELPILDKTIDFAKMGIIPNGAYENQKYLGDKIHFDNSVERYMRDIMGDPQTSGGLMVSVARKDASEMLKRLQAVAPETCIIGEVVSPQEKALEVQ